MGFKFFICVLLGVVITASAYTPSHVTRLWSFSRNLTTGTTSTISSNSRGSTRLFMAQISEAEAKKAINVVSSALKKDKEAIKELGNFVKVNNILGFGMPKSGQIAVRFNASFQKGGKGMSSVPLPFGLGQSKVSEGRGTMVGQVKASVDAKTLKILECSVFRDLGYGRAFNLKT